MIGNLALFALAGMVTLFGTLTTSGRLLLSATRVPPSGAGLAIAANPDAALPPTSVCGSNANILSTRAGELCGAPLGKGRYRGSPILRIIHFSHRRSEERRVGKECRSPW